MGVEMRHVCVSAGEGRFQITLEAVVTDGEGLSCFLYGGTLPHVGGAVLAVPGPTLHGKQLSRVDVWSMTVPGHKDAEAAQQVARKIVIATQQSASVTCGVHVDNATGEELSILGKNIDAATDALIAQLRDGDEVDGQQR